MDRGGKKKSKESGRIGGELYFRGVDDYFVKLKVIVNPWR